MTTHRTLIVMRHAKAEQAAVADNERQLSRRGFGDATASGHWAADHGVIPDYVVVSSAARTRGTWAAFSEASGCAPEIVIDDSLYAAGTDAALEIIRAVPAAARSVMLVGHNPTMAYLVHLLDDGGADPSLFAELASGYPTSAITVLGVAGPWADLDVGTARIQQFHVGRG